MNDSSGFISDLLQGDPVSPDLLAIIADVCEEEGRYEQAQFWRTCALQIRLYHEGPEPFRVFDENSIEDGLPYRLVATVGSSAITLGGDPLRPDRRMPGSHVQGHSHMWECVPSDEGTTWVPLYRLTSQCGYLVTTITMEHLAEFLSGQGAIGVGDTFPRLELRAWGRRTNDCTVRRYEFIDGAWVEEPML